LQPRRSFVAYSGEERYPLAPDVEAIGVRELAELLSGLEVERTAGPSSAAWNLEPRNLS